MNSFLIGLLSSISFFCVLLALEYLTRKNNYPKESSRRIAHFLSGIFGALMGLVLYRWVFMTFVLVFLGIISISYVKKFLSSIHGVKRKTFGEIFLPLGILIAYLVSGPNVNFVISILILSISDPLAGIVCNMKEFKTSKLAGSVIFFLTTSLIIFLFLGVNKLIVIFFISFIVTVVERISGYGTDNLTIPLFVSLLLKYLL